MENGDRQGTHVETVIKDQKNASRIILAKFEVSLVTYSLLGWLYMNYLDYFVLGLLDIKVVY